MTLRYNYALSKKIIQKNAMIKNDLMGNFITNFLVIMEIKIDKIH